jgi:hypothetical protein
VVRFWALSALVIVTIALGTTAPDASVTVPASAPVDDVWDFTRAHSNLKAS